jgi:hypothetical protein
MKTWIEFLGGKKFITVLLLILLSFVALLLDKIDGDIWKYITLGILGIYITGNVTQNIKLKGDQK